jgi:hypothetical protein
MPVMSLGARERPSGLPASADVSPSKNNTAKMMIHPGIVSFFLWWGRIHRESGLPPNFVKHVGCHTTASPNRENGSGKRRFPQVPEPDNAF